MTIIDWFLRTFVTVDVRHAWQQLPPIVPRVTPFCDGTTQIPAFVERVFVLCFVGLDQHRVSDREQLGHLDHAHPHRLRHLLVPLLVVVAQLLVFVASRAMLDRDDDVVALHQTVLRPVLHCVHGQHSFVIICGKCSAGEGHGRPLKSLFRHGFGYFPLVRLCSPFLRFLYEVALGVEYLVGLGHDDRLFHHPGTL